MSYQGKGTVAGQFHQWTGALWVPSSWIVPLALPAADVGKVLTGIAPGVAAFMPGVPGPAGPAPIIPYAPAVQLTGVIPNYIGFGTVNTLEEFVNFVCTRAGTIQNLRINVTLNTLPLGGTANFTIRRSPTCNLAFAPTTQALSVGSGVTGCFVTAGAGVPVVPGDRISLEVALSTAVGVMRATGAVEYA
jgi:hypothetical protein